MENTELGADTTARVTQNETIPRDPPGGFPFLHLLSLVLQVVTLVLMATWMRSWLLPLSVFYMMLCLSVQAPAPASVVPPRSTWPNTTNTDVTTRTRVGSFIVQDVNSK